MMVTNKANPLQPGRGFAFIIIFPDHGGVVTVAIPDFVHSGKCRRNAVFSI